MSAGEPEKRTAGHRPVFLSSVELDRLLATVREAAIRARQTGASRPIIDEVIVLLLVELGLKPRELLALKIGDLPAADSGNTISIRGPRGRKRTMSLSPQTADLLQRFVRRHRAQAEQREPLLLSERGTPLGYMSLYSKLARIGMQAGCGRLNPDVLRRTFLKRLGEREQDLRMVQEQAGHASHKTTARLLGRLDASPSQRGGTATPDTEAAPCGRQTEGTDARHTTGSHAAIVPDQADHGRQTNVACGACGRSFVRAIGIRIDSGQTLCPDCVHELRNTSAPGSHP